MPQKILKSKPRKIFQVHTSNNFWSPCDRVQSTHSASSWEFDEAKHFLDFECLILVYAGLYITMKEFLANEKISHTFFQSQVDDSLTGHMNSSFRLQCDCDGQSIYRMLGTCLGEQFIYLNITFSYHLKCTHLH